MVKATGKGEVYSALAVKKISVLFWQYALPAVVGTTVTTVYNIIDSVFIGHWVGNDALTGLGVILPIMNFISAIGVLIGVGAATCLSISLGSKDKNTVLRIVGSSFLLTLSFSGVTVIVILIFLKPILMFVGADDATYPYIKDFLVIYLPGSVLSTLCFNFNNMMRACGYPVKAMITMLISVFMNMILAPLFIIYFGWGMKGAASATIISVAISFVFVMEHFLVKNSIVPLRLTFMRFYNDIFRMIVSIGLSPFFIQVASSVIVIIINSRLYIYAPREHVSSDIAIAAFANANRLLLFVVMIITGLTQGMQPIVGYNYGAKNLNRVRDTLFYTIIVATVITNIGFLFSFFAPEKLVAIFSSDPQLNRLSANALHYMMMAYSVVGFQMVVSSFYQCIGMPREAIFLSLIRQILFLIPLAMIIPIFFGINGIWYACAISDFVSAIACAIFLHHLLKKFRNRGMSKHIQWS